MVASLQTAARIKLLLSLSLVLVLCTLGVVVHERRVVDGAKKQLDQVTSTLDLLKTTLYSRCVDSVKQKQAEKTKLLAEIEKDDALILSEKTNTFIDAELRGIRVRIYTNERTAFQSELDLLTDAMLNLKRCDIYKKPTIEKSDFQSLGAFDG